MLTVSARAPAAVLLQASYVLNWVFEERLGFPRITLEPHDAAEIVVLLNDGALRLRSPCLGGWGPAGSGAFCRAPQSAPFTRQGAMPLTILFGEGGILTGAGEITFAFDFWGTLFWHLARVEELETEVRDRHGRFAAAQSYLKKQGLLLRPLVDEYVAHLGQAIRAVYPLTEQPLSPRITVTCDVDTPYSRSLRGPKALLRALGGDLLSRRSPRAALATLRNARRVASRRDYSLDPNNMFGWIMDRCEERHLKAAFYFICANHPVDPRYELEEAFVRDVMSAIDQRGHEIGMHGSYLTYQSPEDIASEFAHLRSVCAALGIARECWGNRQHYLRWDMAVTPDALSSAGFDYDTSLSFADHAGFRCGTSHGFPLWSWQRRAPLALREQPLIAMEGAVLDPRYMGCGHAEGRRVLVGLREQCRRYGGNFVLLWHNSDLQTAADRETFIAALDG